MKKLISFCLLLLLSTASINAEENKKPIAIKILHAGILLDVPGTDTKTEQTVVVKEGKIDSVHAGYLSAEELEMTGELEILDLKDKFVLPGLIDGHVHLMGRYGSKFRSPLASGEENLIAGIVNARSTIEAGFTTVADLDAGANSWPIIVLRNAIKAGEITGPRILAAGSSISPTGGHGDYLDGPDDVLERFTSSGLCDGEAECRRAVRRQFRQGSDLIKIHATGGGNERTGGKHNEPSFMQDELEAIVNTAHDLDMKVTAHAHATSGVNAALKAGVDGIEHGSFLDKESIRLFKKTGAYLLPTLDVQDMIADRIDSVPPHFKARLKLYQDEHPANVARAYKAGVKIALGSDAGVVPHGSNAREIEWLVKIGISEAEAIKIATINTADHLGIDKQVGKLEPGMQADIIAVAGDPLKDITVLQKVGFVMKEGKVFKHQQ